MKYFILKQDESYKNTPMIKGIPQEVISPRDLYEKNYNLMPKVTRLETYNSEQIDFIDIITNPILMMSEKTIDIVKMYMPKLATRDITIVDIIGNQTKVYKIPLIPRINSLTQDSRLNENQTNIEKCKIDLKKVKHNPLFYIKESKEDAVVIRLDMIESILKRKLRGINLEEIEAEK